MHKRVCYSLQYLKIRRPSAIALVTSPSMYRIRLCVFHNSPYSRAGTSSVSRRGGSVPFLTVVSILRTDMWTQFRLGLADYKRSTLSSRETNDSSDPVVYGRGFQLLIGYNILIIVLERTGLILLEPHVRLSHPKSFACNTAS